MKVLFYGVCCCVLLAWQLRIESEPAEREVHSTVRARREHNERQRGVVALLGVVQQIFGWFSLRLVWLPCVRP